MTDSIKFESNGSDKLVVSFGGMGGHFDGLPIFEFANSLKPYSP